jgi:parallel beta-helix repeat protein
LLALVCAGCATGETGSGVGLNPRGARVDGRVVSTVGGPVEYWVQYGTTTAYGSETPHASVTVEPNTPLFVFLTIDGLERETEYHYRLCASDSQQGSGGPGCGVDRTLITQSALCGSTVTTSLRLTADLSCPQGEPALIVGADGIDINLAGHRLGVPPVTGGAQLAIRNIGHSDVTIRNGAVDGMIDVEGASRNLIRDIEAISAGAAAIEVDGGAANAIRVSSVFGRGSGIVIHSDDAVVAGSDATGMFGRDISVTGDRALIVRNSVESRNGFTGIDLTGSDGRIADNRVTEGGGIVLVAGANNVIAENEVSDNPFGDGIVVNAFSTGTVLRNNLAQRNDGDGIDVRASNARLRDNSAFDNGLLGINAAPGVTDAGGNRARGNGNLLQCVNVLCVP